MGTKLGQNFLKNPQIAAKIAGVALLNATDTVLEVGPGRGILTTELLARAGKVIAVEKDAPLAEFLKNKFATEIAAGKLILVIGDALKFDPSTINTPSPHKTSLRGRYKVVANIPYYITAHLLRHFLELANQPESMTLMIQKEVATRLTAKPPRMNLLALSVQVYGTPKTAFIVKRGSFLPPPKVDSAVISIGHISRGFFKKHKIKEADFFALLRSGFAHKRKLLAGNLKSISKDYPWKTAGIQGLPLENLESIFLRCGIAPKARAENLSLDDWACLLTT